MIYEQMTKEEWVSKTNPVYVPSVETTYLPSNILTINDKELVGIFRVESFDSKLTLEQFLVSHKIGVVNIFSVFEGVFIIKCLDFMEHEENRKIWEEIKKEI